MAGNPLASAFPSLRLNFATSKSSGRIPRMTLLPIDSCAAGRSAAAKATSILPPSISRKRILSPSAFRQKLTNCNSSCEKELVGLMSGRNERTSSEEKPADCVASSISLKAEGSTDASKTLEAMLPLVYDELRLLAGGYLRNERPEHTLQRTALVHEAYLRLAAQRDVSWENPAHFIAIFARLMRQTLTNHAVARTRAKRGGSDPTDLIVEFYDR